MDALTIANVTQAAHGLWSFLWQPIADTPWSDWRGFWLGQILDDRFVVIYALPCVLILLLLPRHKLRLGIVVTGLTLVCYLFGVLYAALWLLNCLAFHRLSERFAIECRRTDVLKIGPPLAATLIITFWYLGTQMLVQIRLPTELNNWLCEQAPWLFPLGGRELAWEPRFHRLYAPGAAPGPPTLLHALFYDHHNIGTAYFVVRMLHYFSEIKRDTLPGERRTLLNFLAYLCYVPNLIQGPIERFAAFQEQMDTCHQRRSWQNVPPALLRISLGVFKGFVATWYLLPILLDDLGFAHGRVYYKHPERIESFWLLYFGQFLHIFWLYLEFSGYCDISAGLARLLGYRQVENFRMPWVATSLRDFWRRWHISLSQIARDYIYIPLGGNRRHVTLNLCLTFLIVGVWHWPMSQLAIWGIVMGLMLAVNQRWVRWMKRLDENPSGRLPAIRRAWLRLRPLPQLCAWLVTMHAFVFSLLIFFGGNGAINVPRELLRRIWHAITDLGM